MSQKPLIIVSGATGGSVVNSLLATGLYKIRALTRNPNSDKAKALESKGAEVFKCDLSVREEVENALSGADIAWIVTNFLDPSIIGKDPGEEERQSKMIADIAKEKGLNWLIYSSQPDTTTESGGKYPDITHFTGKNHVEQYIRKLGIPNATFAYLSSYSQNIGTFLPLISNENGEIELVIPYFEENDQILLVDVSDTGPTKWNGKKVPIASENVTIKHITDVLTKVTGKTHKLRTLNDEDIVRDIPSLNNKSFKQMLKNLEL
ncbi:hypothetical protein C1646_809641 [Rhizophagus diaphanus]|nr:hypothetical protein C1646_809641 [Rhizophagus diaphanus] [Rhizophagus sp. MUCL 43196]